MQQAFIKFKRLKVIRISVIVMIVLLIRLRRMRWGGNEAHSEEVSCLKCSRMSRFRAHSESSARSEVLKEVLLKTEVL